MIQSITISGVNTPQTNKPRSMFSRKWGDWTDSSSACTKERSAEVKLKEVNRDHGNKYEAEIILNVPDKHITAKDSTVNMLAAVDIVEHKLANQLKKYKDTHVGHIGKTRAALSSFKRSYDSEQQT